MNHLEDKMSMMLEPLTDEEIVSMPERVAKAFNTDADDKQAKPSPEQFRWVRAHEPLALVPQKTTEGKIIGWSAIAPIGSDDADKFVAGTMLEKDVIDGVRDRPGRDVFYFWAVFTDEEYRMLDQTFPFVVAHAREMMRRYPHITRWVTEAFTAPGAHFCDKLAKELGITFEYCPSEFSPETHPKTIGYRFVKRQRFLLKQGLIGDTVIVYERPSSET